MGFMGNDHQKGMGRTEEKMQEVLWNPSQRVCVCYRGEGDNELIRELDLLAHFEESM